MKVAAAQIECELGNLSANLKKVSCFTERARDAGAELIVFPEMTDTGYAVSLIREKANPWSEGAVPELQKIAHKLGISIVCGLSEKENGLIYNSQVAIDPAGTIVAKYRKVHLFAVAPVEEEKCFTAGDCLTSFALGPLRFGLTICYDIRFPELYRTLAVDHKTNCLINSSAWPFPRVEHLRVLATARAIENQSYLILANCVGSGVGTRFCGSSAVIDPYGVLLAAASTDREELVLAELSQDVLETVRRKMPVFSHRRPALYSSGT
jgi:predicted amidohydrolase